MKTWLSNLFRSAPAAPSKSGVWLKLGAPALEEPPEWTPEDRGALLLYLRSESGRKLLEAMRYQEELLKSQACDDTEKRVDHARGQAVGYRKAEATLIILSAPQPHKEETAESADRGAEELRDQLSHN